MGIDSTLRYKKLLIKLSGGALKGSGDNNFDVTALEHIVQEILAIVKIGIKVALVTGGGNIFRGNSVKYWGIERAEADNVGMLGTVMNALMLKEALKARSDCKIRVMTAIKMETIAEPFFRLRALSYLNKGYIVILAGGIGQPFVTTDYTAAQRAVELKCDALFVAKHGVNGVFNLDPQKNKDAKQYSTLAYNDFLTNRLNIIDYSAVLLARDYNLPIHIFNFDKDNAMGEICFGKNIGTYISSTTKMQFEDSKESL